MKPSWLASAPLKRDCTFDRNWVRVIGFAASAAAGAGAFLAGAGAAVAKTGAATTSAIAEPRRRKEVDTGISPKDRQMELGGRGITLCRAPVDAVSGRIPCSQLNCEISGTARGPPLFARA